jgi:hypothetical protein
MASQSSLMVLLPWAVGIATAGLLAFFLRALLGSRRTKRQADQVQIYLPPLRPSERDYKVEKFFK